MADSVADVVVEAAEQLGKVVAENLTNGTNTTVAENSVEREETKNIVTNRLLRNNKKDVFVSGQLQTYANC